MSEEQDKHVLVHAESLLAFTALIILGGLTFYALVRWNSEVSGSLVLGTVIVFRDVVTKFSDKASNVIASTTTTATQTDTTTTKKEGQ